MPGTMLNMTASGFPIPEHQFATSELLFFSCSKGYHIGKHTFSDLSSPEYECLEGRDYLVVFC